MQQILQVIIYFEILISMTFQQIVVRKFTITVLN